MWINFLKQLTMLYGITGSQRLQYLQDANKKLIPKGMTVQEAFESQQPLFTNYVKWDKDRIAFMTDLYTNSDVVQLQIEEIGERDCVRCIISDESYFECTDDYMIPMINGERKKVTECKLNEVIVRFALDYSFSINGQPQLHFFTRRYIRDIEYIGKQKAYAIKLMYSDNNCAFSDGFHIDTICGREIPEEDGKTYKNISTIML